MRSLFSISVIISFQKLYEDMQFITFWHLFSLSMMPLKSIQQLGWINSLLFFFLIFIMEQYSIPIVVYQGNLRINSAFKEGKLPSWKNIYIYLYIKNIYIYNHRLAKKFIWVLYKMLWKSSNELFGQLNTCRYICVNFYVNFIWPRQ